MSAAGVEIAQAYVAIYTKMPGVQRDINKALGGVDTAPAGAKIGSKLAVGMRTSLKAGGAAAAAVLGAALVKGFGRLKAIEAAQAKMRGLGHDAATVSKAMDNSLAAVKGTAFGLGDAATAAGLLMAANIKPGRELEGVLKTVGNNASAAGVQFDEMGSIFAKAATQANGVQNDILSQLADKGIPIYQAIAKQAGVTAGEVFKMASEGEISFDMFQRAATVAAGTVADEMGKTTTGSFDNMVAALGRLGAKLLEDIYPLIGPLFRNITTWLDAAAAKVEPFLGGLSAVVGLFKDGNFSAQLREAFGWEEDSGIVTFLLGLRTTAINVFTEVAGGIRAFGAAFQAGGTDVTSSGFAGFLERAGLVARFLWDTLTTKLIPGLIGVGGWVVDNRDWIGALALAVGGAAVAYGAWTISIKAWNFAAGIATKTQTIFNAVLNANPIMKIVMLISGLVAGLVWFFTQTETGKKIFAEFTRFLGEAWANISAFFTAAYENVIRPVFESIKTALQAVGDFFVSVWTGYIKPVWDALSAAATWLWTTILQPIFQAIQLGFAIVGGIIAGVYEYIVKPILLGIGSVLKWLWDTVISVIINLIIIQVKAWAAVFRWLWANVLQPIVSAIGTAFRWIYQNVIVPVINGIKVYIRAWAMIVQWLYAKALKPALDAIAAVFKWIWSVIIGPIVGWIQEKIRILGLAFGVMYAQHIKPAWDRVSSIISTVWNKVKSVIDTMVRVVKTDPKKAFELARDAIGLAWAGIKKLAATPVRFVIERVFNDGLIAGINTILPKSMELKPIPLPKGFARGGILPGMSRMQDGDDQLIMARRGEGMMVSEALRTPADRSAFLAANAAGQRGVGFASMVPGFARGGMIDPLPRGSFSVSQPWHGGHNGIDLAAPSGTRVLAATDGVVQLAGVVPMGGNEIYLQGSNGIGTRYSHLSRFATSVGRKVKQGNVIGYVGSTGMSTGPHLHYMVHNPGQGPGSYYPNQNPAGYMGRAGKVLGEAGGAGGVASVLSGLGDLVTSKVKEMFPGGGWAVDVAMGIAQTAAKKLQDFANPFAASDGHTQIKPMLYDQGGWLPPGLSLVNNKTGVPEPVFNRPDFDDLIGGRGGSLDGTRMVLVLDDGRELSGYVREIADDAVDQGFEELEAAGRRVGV